MSDDIKFTCELCRKQFDPDPDTMLEVFIGGSCPCCDGKEHPLTGAVPDGPPEGFTVEELSAMNAEQLAAIGLTPETRDALLRGEEVPISGMCICKECQDSLPGEPPHSDS